MAAIVVAADLIAYYASYYILPSLIWVGYGAFLWWYGWRIRPQTTGARALHGFASLCRSRILACDLPTATLQMTGAATAVAGSAITIIWPSGPDRSNGSFYLMLFALNLQYLVVKLLVTIRDRFR